MILNRKFIVKVLDTVRIYTKLYDIVIHSMVATIIVTVIPLPIHKDPPLNVRFTYLSSPSFPGLGLDILFLHIHLQFLKFSNSWKKNW